MVTIVCEGLEVSLGGRPVLSGIDLRLDSGGLIGVIGPNGAGKSTLARAMLALVPPAAGRVLIDGSDAARLRAPELARRIAYLPQGQELHWPLSVERLIGLGRLPHLAPFSRIGAADGTAIEAAMRDTGTLALRHRIATELSGGERARVMLARALATGAPALIADEPLASLDPGHQMEVMALLANRAQAGLLVIVVLHDLSVAARFCDRLLLIDAGRLVADGAPGDVLTDAALAEVYGIAAWRGEAGGVPLLVPLSRLG
ncbi:MAG TPA: ABC transporter ATP-binding protein [Sphingomonas sp.]|nr:ABC transporter ATP-binding protein [Sphingomonas sp.]